MKKYMMIYFMVLHPMMISAMDIRKNDMAEVKKMEILRNIRALQKRASIESMENSTQSSEDMSLERSGSSSGSFSMPIPIQRKPSNFSITGLVGSPSK